MELLSGLDLFSGIGGIGLALEPWVRTVAYCEREPYAQGVLLSRMQSGDIDTAPIWHDVTTLQGSMLPNIDIIFGGFPCQDISVAGHGKGLAGERSGLFFEIARLARELRPTFIFLENVPAIRTRGADRVCKELASLGYDCRWTTLTASAVGARHKRDRWFLLAYAKGQRVQGLRASGEQEPYAYVQQRLSMCEGERRIQTNWKTEPSVDRVVDGLLHRAHRIKCLGNSVVPLQVQTAFKKLLNLHNAEMPTVR